MTDNIKLAEKGWRGRYGSETVEIAGALLRLCRHWRLSGNGLRRSMELEWEMLEPYPRTKGSLIIETIVILRR